MHSDQFQLHAAIEDRHWWFVARRRIMRRLIAEVLPPRGSKTTAGDAQRTQIVDVGCGTGANLAGLADDYDCLGIDTSPEAILFARRRFPGVRFIHGFAPRDLGDIAAEANLFLLMDVLEHVPDDFELLSELLAAASPGSRFLITVPADMSLWSQHDESFGHYRRYTLERFAQVWQGLPVRTRLLSHYNARLYPLVKFIRNKNQRRGATGGAANTDFSLPSAPVNSALTRFFAGESTRLRKLLQGRRAKPYLRGVSLIALLERGEGVIEPRQKPHSLPADPWRPGTSSLLQMVESQ